MITRKIKNENNEHILLLNNGVYAHAVLYGGTEFEIMVYRRGGRKEAEDITVNGGKMSQSSRSNDASMFLTLLKEAKNTWQGKKVWCDPCDERRNRVYQLLAKRAGVEISVGSIMEIQF